jgi:HAD superfamily hydrolase (TIGR01509 family)
MSPFELMRSRRDALRLVIFDCDGVIVDSEAISNRIIAEDLTSLGWSMDEAEARRRFLGTSLRDMVPVIEARVGRLPPEWRGQLVARITGAMGVEAQPIPGAIEAMRAISALGLPWRIASNSSHAEMSAKFDALGITAMVAGRTHSFQDVAKPKPAPDVFLAAASAEGVRPVNCVVIEDSVAGATAAASAEMDCLGFAFHSDAAALRAAGAVPFSAMTELPALIEAGLRAAA